MVARVIARQRLQQQRLAQHALPTAEAVVTWLGAVQAQDYGGAQWALGMRMQHATADLIEQACTAGTILRTHVLRPTWHFVMPADIRWLLDLTAPRIKRLLASNDRHLQIDASLVGRATTVLETALEGGQYRTRPELGAILADAGVAATGQRLGHLMMHAELNGIVCSGPRRGNQFTYALLNERAPNARQLPRDEALAELTRRYFAGHGPATVHDFAWWSGLTVADAKAGLAMVAADLMKTEFDGHTYYTALSFAPAAEDSPTAWLLPTYDEFLVGYAGFDRARRGGRDSTDQVMFESAIVIDGTVVGSWRRTLRQGRVLIEWAPFGSLTAADNAAVAAAAWRYGAFIGCTAQLTRVASSAQGATRLNGGV